MTDRQKSLLQMVRRQGLVRPRDIEKAGLSRMALTRLVRSGLLTRVGRGLYALPDRDVSENVSLAEVAKKCPHAIVYLLSALRFHNLATQSPLEVWVAIPNKARPPRLDYPPVRIVRFSGAALTRGIEQHVIDGVPVNITSAARSVVDCFRFRNKLGLDVTLEALRDAHEQRIPLDAIWEHAERFRQTNVIRPYLESLPYPVVRHPAASDSASV